MGDRITIFDTTLRDGEQAPGFSLTVGEKLQLARQLDALGVDVIEAGFPIASDADAEAVRTVAADVRRPIVAALARCRPDDIDRAGRSVGAAARPRIHTFIATSDLHLTRKLNIPAKACLEAAVAASDAGAPCTDDVQFSAEDATRTDLDFLCRVIEGVIDAGATTINLPDTVGYATPDEISAFFTTVLARVPNAARAVFSAHCHDDLGLAVANTLVALQAGVRQVECTINGIGERAGNASLEEIVMATRVRADRLPFESSIATPCCSPRASCSVAHGRSRPGQQGDCRAQRVRARGGIHQDGMLKDRRTYEIMRPEDVGVPATTLVLGKHSGRHALQHRLASLGVEVTRLESWIGSTGA